MAHVVPQTILAQLGGNRFLAMTGAKDLVGSETTLRFKLPRGAKDGINLVAITLEPSDLYRVVFSKWSPRKLEATTVAELSGAYAEDLQPLFTNATGLFTRL